MQDVSLVQRVPGLRRYDQVESSEKGCKERFVAGHAEWKNGRGCKRQYVNGRVNSWALDCKNKLVLDE